MAAEEGGQKRPLDLEDEVLSLEDVLEEHDAMEQEACAVLGGSDPEQCSYPQGYIKRQALYACSTCTPKGEEAAGICLACSYKCHEGHDLIELYTKRNFRCDCGNNKFKNMQCKLYPDKLDVNILNKYDDNFFGLYCTCKRAYLEDETPDEMIQCVVCEDWFHERHLGAVPEENMDFQEMVCPSCMKHCSFLWAYAAQLSVPTVTRITPLDTSTEEVEVTDDNKIGSKVLENGDDHASNDAKASADETKAVVQAKEELRPCNGPSTSKIVNGDAKIEDGVTTACRLKSLSFNQVVKDETATYWPLHWRTKLCGCQHCLALYSELDLPFLLDECDTVIAYETKGKSDETNRQDPLMSALNRMDRVQQVELIYQYNDMKSELKDYLKSFAEQGKVRVKKLASREALIRSRLSPSQHYSLLTETEREVAALIDCSMIEGLGQQDTEASHAGHLSYSPATEVTLGGQSASTCTSLPPSQHTSADGAGPSSSHRGRGAQRRVVVGPSRITVPHGRGASVSCVLEAASMEPAGLAVHSSSETEADMEGMYADEVLRFLTRPIRRRHRRPLGQLFYPPPVAFVDPEVLVAATEESSAEGSMLPPGSFVETHIPLEVEGLLHFSPHLLSPPPPPLRTSPPARRTPPSPVVAAPEPNLEPLEMPRRRGRARTRGLSEQELEWNEVFHDLQRQHHTDLEGIQSTLEGFRSDQATFCGEQLGLLKGIKVHLGQLVEAERQKVELAKETRAMEKERLVLERQRLALER